jgi:segregation and condensation protein A
LICRFTVSRFEGPLDLLLFLIRKNEVDITDIPIASITRQYLEYLEVIQRLDLDEAGNYLLMASTLMNIKSQMLLPTEDALPLEEFEDPRMDLVRRLKAYQIVKDVAMDLRSMEAEAGRHMPRAYFPEFSESDLETVSMGEVSFVDFLQAFLRCINRWEDVAHRVQAQKINLNDMISRIVKRLGDSEKITWRELLTETTNRMERVLVLLALLEMTRQQQVTLRQTRAYGNLWVIPSQNYGLQRAS